MLVVSDTSPFSSLLLIGQADWLLQLFGEVVAPEAVRDELSVTFANLPAWLQIDLRFCHIPAEAARANLDRGESEAIALALDIHADDLLMDERKGRQVARALGLHVTGLLGILVLAKEGGLISAVKPWIERLQRDTHCWFDTKLVEEVLRLVDE